MHDLKSFNELSATTIADAETFLRKQDKRLAALIQNVGPCTLANNNKNKFEVLATSIVSQQLSGKAVSKIFNRLLHRRKS